MTGKKTIVTGGDSGIGRAAAVMFAMEGADVGSLPLKVLRQGTDVMAKVAIVYLPEEQVDAEKTKSLIEGYGRQCLLYPQDIRDEAGCNRVIQSVADAFGRIDVLVNNASVMVCPPSRTSLVEAALTRTSTPSPTSQTLRLSNSTEQ